MESLKTVSLNPQQASPGFEHMNTHFYEYFKLVVANTPKLREEVYKIRYQVYCKELNYEREEDCRDGMERDIYDQRSIHCLLLHRSSGVYAGCVRLILPAPGNLEKSLPVEKVCSLKPNGIELNNLHRYCFGEVSRLAVRGEFRRRKGEAQSPHGVSAEESTAVENERRHFPLIAIGLYLAAISIAQEIDLNSIFTLMEPRLARHLRRFGINSCQIGDSVEFHGERGPFQINLETVASGMNTNVHELFQAIRADMQMTLGRSTDLLHNIAA